MATYQFGDKSAINLMMAITNGLDREFAKRTEISDMVSRLADVESRMNSLSGGLNSSGITAIQLNGTRLPVTSGVVNINIPMQLSSYLNDSNFQNAGDVRAIFTSMLEEAIASGMIGQGGGSAGGNSVKIKAKPNSVVVFTHPDGTVITGKADENGDLVVDLPKTGGWSVESVSGNTTIAGSVTVDGNGQKTVDVTTGSTKPVDDYIVEMKTEPFATVAFVHPDGTVVTARADANGNIIVVLPKSGNWRKIVAVGGSTVTDEVPVTNPGINKVDDTPSADPTPEKKYPVNVKVAPNATVIFTGPDGTTVSAKADSSGNLSVDLPYEGQWDITSFTPDEKTQTGTVNVTTPNSTKEVDISGQTPQQPDEYIVTLKVKPGATVTLVHPDGTTVTGVADSNGNLAVVVPKTGEWTVVSMSGGKTDTGSVDVETPGNNEVNVGGSEDGEVCTHVLEVTTTPGATVTAVLSDGTRVSAVADTNGKAVLILPKTGDWTVVSTDTDGNINGSGDADISGNGTSKTDVTNTGENNLPANTKIVTVKGEPNSKVTLVGPSGEIITGVTDANGIFTTTVPSQGEWTIVTTTLGGTTSSGTVDVQPGQNGSSSATITPGGDNPTPPVSGSYPATVNTTPGATVYFVHPDGTVVKGVADNNGVCSAVLPKDGEWKIITTESDGSGIGDGDITVGNNQPSNPSTTVTAPSGNANTVVITTNANATVTLVDGSGNTVSTKADENGVAIVDVPNKGSWTVITSKNGETATGSVTIGNDGKAQSVTVYPIPVSDDSVTTIVKTTPNSDVYIVDSAGNVVTGHTDSSGNIIVSLPHEGDWTVITIKPDGSSTDATVNVTDNGYTQTVDVTGTTKPSGKVYPVIVTTDPGATVTIVSSGGTTVTGKADENGVAILNAPSAGDWTVIATKDGKTATQVVNVSSNGTATTVTNKPSGNVTPPPVSGDSTVNIKTLASAMIIAEDDGGNITSTNADTKGVGSLDLSAGTWKIIGVQGDKIVDKTVTVPTNENPVQILTPSGNTFMVYVTTKKNSEIVALHSDGTRLTADADASGFSIMILPKKGDWTFTAPDNSGNNRSMIMNISNPNNVLKLNFRTGEITGGGSEEGIVEDTFEATIYGMPNSTIYGINQANGDATSGSADKNGKVDIQFDSSGLWRVFSVDGSVYYDGVVLVSPTGEVTSTKINGNTGTIFIVYLTTDRGANYTFTHTDGTLVSGQADYDSGFDTVFLPKTGTWTLNTNDGAGKVTSKNVVVENIGELLRVRSKA